MINSPVSTVEGRPYRRVKRPIGFKIDARKVPGWQYQTVDDCAYLAGNALVGWINREVFHYKEVLRVYMKGKIQLQCDALQNAFPRNCVAIEPSSDVLEIPSKPRRTQQQLNESRAMDRAELVQTAHDYIATHQSILIIGF